MPELTHLAHLTARPFASRDEAIGAVLELLHQQTALRTPFLARTNQGRFEVIAAASHEGCPLNAGMTLPLEDAY